MASVTKFWYETDLGSRSIANGVGQSRVVIEVASYGYRWSWTKRVYICNGH